MHSQYISAIQSSPFTLGTCRQAKKIPTLQNFVQVVKSMFQFWPRKVKMCKEWYLIYTQNEKINKNVCWCASIAWSILVLSFSKLYSYASVWRKVAASWKYSKNTFYPKKNSIWIPIWIRHKRLRFSKTLVWVRNAIKMWYF